MKKIIIFKNTIFLEHLKELITYYSLSLPADPDVVRSEEEEVWSAENFKADEDNLLYFVRNATTTYMIVGNNDYAKEISATSGNKIIEFYELTK